jgi:hypothetical protein
MSIFIRTGRGTAEAETDRGLIRSGAAGRSPAQNTVTGHQPPAAGSPAAAPAARRAQPLPARMDRRYAVVLLAAAATFGIASYLHLDGNIPLGFTTITGEHFSRASIPEAIIGAVLAAGAAIVTAAPGRARTAALGAARIAAQRRWMCFSRLRRLSLLIPSAARRGPGTGSAGRRSPAPPSGRRCFA